MVRAECSAKLISSSHGASQSPMAYKRNLLPLQTKTPFPEASKLPISYIIMPGVQAHLLTLLKHQGTELEKEIIKKPEGP